MKNLRTVYTLVTAAIFLAGCNQDPPQGGTITENQQEPKPLFPAYSLDMRNLLYCYEGSTCSVAIQGHVPDGQTPELTFSNLPNGAVYDPASKYLTYTPDYSLIDQAVDPDKNSLLFEPEVVLKSKEDGITSIRRKLYIVVENVARPIAMTIKNMKVSRPWIGKSRLTCDIEASSSDFPAAQLTLLVNNPPEGMRVTPVKNEKNKWTFSYRYKKPRKKQNDPTSIAVRFVFGTPAKRLLERTETLPLLPASERFSEAPLVSVRDEVEAYKSSVSFLITASDPEGEKQPKLSRFPVAPVGKLAHTLVTAGRSDSSDDSDDPTEKTYLITWSGLPESRVKDEKIPLAFTFCSQVTGECTDSTVNVKLYDGAQP